MKNYSPVSILSTLFVIFYFDASLGTDTTQVARPADTVSREDSTKNEVKFEYLVKTENCNTVFSQIKDKHLIKRNCIKVQFCGGGGACTDIYSLIQNRDTLNINGKCAPKSEMQHVRCYCVFCKISGLKKGIYYLKYGDGYKGFIYNKVEIK